jgi:membrane peptidoglycan carboxypeptidase
MARTIKRRVKPLPKVGPLERMLRGLLRVLWWAGLRLGLLAAAGLAVATAFYASRLPPLEDLLDGREGGSVTFADARGEVFAWRGEQHRVTRVDQVSPHLVNAIIATEDRRFHRHFGVDLRGTARAALVNLRAGETVQGGSSLTQQAAKLIWFDNTRTLERKIKEIPAALALEWTFTKDEICRSISTAPISGRARPASRRRASATSASPRRR